MVSRHNKPVLLSGHTHIAVCSVEDFRDYSESAVLALACSPDYED